MRHRLLLTFTYGISLQTWKEEGFLSREISYYKRFIQKNIDVTFLTYGDRKDLEFNNIGMGIKVVPILYQSYVRKSKMVLLKSLILPIKMKSLFKNVSIIKTNQINGCWIAIIAKLLYRKPIIIRGGYERLVDHINKYRFRKKEPYYKYIIKYIWIFFNDLLAYKLADKIFLTSKKDIDYIGRIFHLNKKKIIQIINFIDTDLFRPLKLENKHNKALYVGSLTFPKNLPNLIKAFDGSTEYELDIIGAGDYGNKLKKMVEDLDLKVNFLGTINNENLPEIINQYEVFILVSHYEGNPKALLEAMSCGIACIGSDVPGIKAIITHMKNGIICQGTPDSIKEALRRLFGDSGLREELGKEARSFVLENCSLDAIIEKEYRVYKKIINRD